MMLKNFMEEKQLDYNQPFLSARRFGASSEVEDDKKGDNFHRSIPALPFYKSELKSGPIRTAGTVPFVWEQSPGRPKDEKKSQIQAFGRPPVAPKLPPGRIVNIKQQAMDKVSEDPASTRTQTGNPLYRSNNVPSVDETATKFGSSKNENEEKQSFCSENGDETYMDALDTLSRTESFFLNCSVSGLSGLDGLDVKQSGTFSTDQQTRDFMMDRFLPAAKAMASETPQYASRGQPVAWEQSRQPKKVVSSDRHPPVCHRRPVVVPYYAQNSCEEESEGEDSEYGEHENLSGKACGLFPRFCLKSSFFVMNPVPGMRIGGQVPASSVRTVRAKSTYAGACSETKHEGRSVGRPQKTELHKDSTYSKEGSNHINYQTNSRKPDGSSLYRRLQGGGISSYQDEFSQSPSHEDKRFLGSPEKANNFRGNDVGLHDDHNSFQELLGNQSTNWESGSSSPMVEKTLYIDSVHTLASPNSNSSSDSKGLIDSRESDSEIPVKCRAMEEFSSVDSSLQDIKHLSNADENATILLKTLGPIDSCLLSSSAISNQEVEVDIIKDFKQDQDFIIDSICLEGPKLSDIRKTNSENQWSTKTDNEENSLVTFPQFPLPPPLPKSPSESWLCRALPVSARNQSSRSFLGVYTHNRPQASKTTILDVKRETVKASDVPLGHSQFSKDLLAPIPEN